MPAGHSWPPHPSFGSSWRRSGGLRRLSKESDVVRGDWGRGGGTRSWEIWRMDKSGGGRVILDFERFCGVMSSGYELNFEVGGLRSSEKRILP